MAATLHLHGPKPKPAAREETDTARYEVCELVRGRMGSAVVRVLATAETKDGALLACRTVSSEAGPDIGPIAIYDTATRMWLSH